MASFCHRSFELEKMDLRGFSFEEYEQCLKDITRMSRLTRQDRGLFKKIRGVYAAGNWSEDQPMTLLDVGFGSGDLLLQLAQSEMHLKLIGVDLNPWAKRVAEANFQAAGIDGVELFAEDANLFSTSRSHCVDVIVSSLVAHHLSDEDLQRHVEWMNRTAEKAWFIGDLHRHRLAYIGAQVLCKIMGVCPMVENDAPLSVLRSLRKNEWSNLLQKMPKKDFSWQVKTSFPFKIIVSGQPRRAVAREQIQ